MRIFKKKTYPITRMLALGFLGAIIAGTLLLSLPFASSDGQCTAFIDALFTAVTSVCVTGLTTVSVYEHWNFFGQFVILILMQLGGLGVVTFSTIFLMVFGKRITLKNRLLIQSAYGLETLSGLLRMTSRILKGTLIVEGLGALAYYIHLIPVKGWVNGLWCAIFQSVSAFCNAGMDVLGNTSLFEYRDDVIMNLITCALIILGGIGFPVWWNIIEVNREIRTRDKNKSRALLKLSLHTKLVCTTTLILLAGGTILTLILEYNNPETIGQLPFGNKLLASFFQSVTTRTAGFYTIPQESLNSSTAMVQLILMFIGGSPSGTAGGIKTVTIGVIIISTIAIIRDSREAEAFGRRISEEYLRKALAVALVSIATFMTATILLAAVQQSALIDTLYETVSATATVGLSRGLTTQLNTGGKIIIICCMYLGRIGPISLALLFNSSRKEVKGRLPDGKLILG